ncbi:MAG: lytic transglycosylase domain-containing protein [Pseudomonadota bacterium]
MICSCHLRTLSSAILLLAAGAAWATPAVRPEARPTVELPRYQLAPVARPDGVLKRPAPSVSTKAVAAPRQIVPEVPPLAIALTRMREDDWGSALRIAGQRNSVGRDIIEWHRLRASRGTFDEVVAFLDRRADWPGLSYLRRQSESAVSLDASAAETIAFFAEEPPQTGTGVLALADAQDEMGNAEAAKQLRIRAWREFVLTASQESALLAGHGEMLQPHHVARLDNLLWRGADKAAQRMFPRVTEARRALARARIALQNKADGVDALIDNVPASLKGDGGLAYDRFDWRMDKRLRDSALEMILSRPGTVKGLGRPEYWGERRRVMARQQMRAGEADVAYKLASSHGMSPEDGYVYSDLEWLSGYIALTYLDDPEAALKHFQTFRASIETPISLGRAGYWEGRAYEAMGDTANAQAAYEFGGEWQTSFYGLLAAEEAGLPMDPALTGNHGGDNWRLAAFRNSSVFQAANLLRDAGEEYLTERFLTHLAEGLSEEEVAQLGDFAIEIDEPHIALMIGKRAAQGGVVIPHAYFPVVDLGLGPLPVPEELALSIARRESEFDHDVKSPAGALGLMQVMPATAREVAGQLSIGYSRSRLLNDAVYNARLGVTYLDGLIDRFGHNYVFVSAGYNAGPGRPARWMRERGDPRGSVEEMVDWIEHIPFRETRNYAMRVMESIPVYRARLTGEVAPITLSDELLVR